VNEDEKILDLEIEVATTARLFGLINSNRDFSVADSWGKNQFNSSFPAALCCYMSSINLEANYLYVVDSKFSIGALSVANLFGAEPLAETTHFAFETAFSPYEKFAIDRMPRTDLVVATTKYPARQTAALEVKLTAIPDSTTCMLDESQYGAELVVRPDTIFYLVAGLAYDNHEKIKIAFSADEVPLEDLGTTKAALLHYPKIHESLLQFVKSEDLVQRPNIIQPVWKTVGKSPRLADQCLDLFVWSTAGFLYFVLDIAKPSGQKAISRQMRTVIWAYKMLVDISGTGKTDFQSTIDALTYGNKNDKAFATAGAVTHKYMSHQNLLRPRVSKSEIASIVIGGGENMLSPERRFDAIIVNSPEIFTK
jgi:type II restriction enzyme